MRITIDSHSGFCFGVTRAIQTAQQELSSGPLYCLGDIVHNGQEVKRLELLGLQTIDYDDLRTLPSYSRVLLRAHGEPPSTYWIAQQKGIEIIDATCPVVKKLQDRIRTCYMAHHDDEDLPPQIVIYGKPGHAEVIGLQGQTNNTAIVIESAEQIDLLDFNRHIYLFSQTTKSVEGFHALVDAIQSRIDNPESRIENQASAPFFEAHDTICRNVANRVAQLQDFARDNDIVIFVGGTKSSNARVLFNHCLDANPHTIFISSPENIEEQIINYKSEICNPDTRVGICGATSTPLWLMEKVKEAVETIPNNR